MTITGRVIGIAQAGTRSTYVLDFAPDKKVTSKVYCGPESGFPVRVDDSIHRDDGDHLVQTFADDYRPVDGVYFLFRIRQVEKGDIFTMRLTQIKNNPAVDDSVFLKTMRKQLAAVALGLLSLAIANSLYAQAAPQDAPQAAAKNTPPSPATTPSAWAPSTNAANASTTYFIQSEQPMTLGELARRERARKSTQAKAVRIFDDENMPRAPISTGEKAPGFGDASSSSSGKVTLLDFWATWCGPCRHALPGLKQVQSVYGSDQLEIISVSEDDDEDTWHEFVAQNGMTWTQQMDTDHQMMRQYGASALPTYVLIGKDGSVVNQYVGDDPDEPIIERIGPDLKKSLDGKS